MYVETPVEGVASVLEIEEDRARENLGSHGVTASAKTQRKPAASVADELVRSAESELADLIVCGAYGHSRIGEWVFGGVTRDLLDHAPICCLMAH